MNYKTINNLTGWGVFLIALVVYLLTVAPTASFWDCGEFIACSNELEVTHPPGAPLFLLLGRIMAMFSFGDPHLVAFMVNLLSVFSSAFTALFTCWTITMLAKKATDKIASDGTQRTLAIMAAGVVGGLACTFADSIWFNAVEAEVYAMSSFFTAVVVWLIFKWEARADEPDHLRWILLIAYVMGLSIGVHLLNLLAIPALALVYYFRKFDFSIKGLLITLGISIAALGLVQYGIIQYTFSLAWQFEKFFTGTVDGNDVTGMGLPMGTGSLIYGILLLTLVIGLIWQSLRRNWVVVNMVVMAYALIMVGFSSYALIFIRSNANPPIDMNNPENILTFLSYMKREQYGDRPLVKGTLYYAQPTTEVRGQYRYPKYEVTGEKYVKVEGNKRYVKDIDVREPVYADRDIVWFPRMYSADRYNRGPYGYQRYVKRTGAKAQNGRDKSPYDDRPTRGEDLLFFLDYQLNHMYFRYFMWNFAGRPSDIQDDPVGWEAGFISAENERNADNKGKNHYFLLPLFLGLLGVVWHFFSDKNYAAVIAALFFFTGIAIIIYLNQYPSQPRERDYSYAGSFQTFCIWIGLGVMFLNEVFRKYLGKKSAYVAGAIGLMIPLLMAVQNWDDHTRKGRWIDIDFAYNMLNSCAPNAILFTAGDNDTFPLWYVQEVEGHRTDVRVVNLELLISDWYIAHMAQPHNGSPGIPISMKPSEYTGDKGQVIQGNFRKKIYLPVDKEALVQNEVITPDEVNRLDSVMVWDFKARSPNYILRKDSAMIDILRNVAKDGWKRPVYFGSSMSPSNFLNLDDYMHMEGLAYRVLPMKKRDLESNRYVPYGDVREAVAYKNITEQFQFRGLDNPKVHLDEHIRVVILNNYRSAFFRMKSTYGDLIARLKSREAVLKADSTADPAIAAQLASIDARVEEATANLLHLTTFMKEKMPPAIFHRDLNLLLRATQPLLKAQIYDEVALAEFDALKAEVERQFAIKGKAMNQNDRAFQGGLLLIQFYVEGGRLSEARGVAGMIKDITGSDIGHQMIQQLQQGK